MTPPTRRRVAALAAAAAFAGTAGAETSPWYVGVSQGFTHDSNVRLARDGAATQSSTISTTSLLGGLDQPIGRQRLYGTLSVQVNRYSGAKDLNNTSYNLNGGLDWATAERIQGTLSAQLNQNLATIDDGTNTQRATKNIAKAAVFDGVVRVGVTTPLTLIGGLNHRTLDYSDNRYQVLEYSQDALRAGVRYRLSGALTLGTTLRHTRTDYPRYRNLGNDQFLADRVRRDDLDFTANWIPSGASTLDLRLSASRVRHSEALESNLSGGTGSLSWNWKPTGKIRLVTSLIHDTGDDVYFASLVPIPGTVLVTSGTVDTSRVTTRLQLAATYDATAKISVNGNLTYAHRSLERTSVPLVGATTTTTDSDNTTRLGLGASWAPTRSVLVRCDLARDQRSGGGVLTAPYSVNTFGCSGQFVIQ